MPDPVTGRTTKPVSGLKFLVSCEKLGPDPMAVGFSKVFGLEAETEIIEYRAGTDKPTPRKIPGLARFPMVVLEKGVAADRSLLLWYFEVSDLRAGGGEDGRAGFAADVTIRLLDRMGAPIRRWTLVDAWPSKLIHDDLDASRSDVLLHRLELCHEGLLTN